MVRSKLHQAFMVFLAFSLLLTSAAAAFASEAQAADAQLSNPGFEEPVGADGSIPGWTQTFGVGKNGSVSVSGDVYAEGTHSLKIVDADNDYFGVQSDRVSIAPGIKYTAGAEVYIQGGTVQLQIRFFNEAGTYLGAVVHDPNFTSTPQNVWQRLTVSAEAPANAASAAIVAVSGKGATGVSYWDAFSLAEAVEEPEPEPEPEPSNRFIVNGGFEASVSNGIIPGWKVNSGNVTVSSEKAFDGSNSLYISNAANVGPAVNVESELIDVEEGVTYTLAADVFLQVGALEGFYIYVYDAEGKLLNGPTGGSFTMYLNKLSPAEEWTRAVGSFTVQPGGVKAKVSIISGNRKSYQVFIDNVSILKSVVNGDFEAELAADGTIPGWKQFTPATDGDNFAVTGERAASGSKSLVIENDPGFYMNVIGDLIPVEAGETYTATAKTFIEYGSTGMYVRYFGANGAYLGQQHWSILSQPADVWFTNYVIGEVPAGASYAAVMFAGSNQSSYRYFVDDVTFLKGAHPVVEEEPIPENSIVNVGVDLGVQIRKATIMRGDMGQFGDGRDVIYTVVQGAPAMFTAIDVATEEVVMSKPLPDTSGAWAVEVSTDGTVYLGGFNLGLLWRYIPATDELVNLGHPLPTKDSVIYPMDPDGDGRIYGGTYPTGSLWMYDPATGKFTDYGTMAFGSSGERWNRVTVYDPERGVVYAGMGNTPRLVEYNPATGAKRDLLPAGYENITAVYDLDLVGGKLFARKETNNQFEYFVVDPVSGEQIMVTNGDTGEVSDVFLNVSRGVSPKSPIADKMYYAGLGGELFEYDLVTDTYRSLGVSIDGAAISYDYVQLNEEGFPGWSLVGLSGNSGKMYKYNLETGNVRVADVMLPAEPVDIHEIVTGPDGNIYTAGYLAGNMGMYNVVTGESRYFNGISQGEGMVTIGNSIFIGAYPDAKIYEYDLSKPWNRDNADLLNPELLFSMYSNDSIPGYTLQDRPFGMAGSEELGMLFVGTVPKNGMLGGALAVYDLEERGEPDVYWNIVEDQSIISLVYADGYLYGGTSIHGGQGGSPTQSEAVLFVWDVAAAEIVYETVPVAGKTSITALHAGPDGNIWGLANGALFIFDPETREVVYSANEFPSASGRWIDGSLVTGTDGNVYGTVDGKFFKVDAATKEVTVLATQARHVAVDPFGNFYLYSSSGVNLYKYTIPELVLPLTGAELSVSDAFVRVGKKLPVTVKGVLGGGVNTIQLSNASVVEYTFSKPDRVRVEADGTLTALRPGNVELVAKVTLGGVTVTSNKIRVVISNASENADPNVPSTPGAK